MSYWNSEHLHREGTNLFEPFRQEQIANCSYELTLGREGYVTGQDFGRKILLPEQGDQLVIPAGQFGLLLTEEIIRIPDHAIGFISVKSAFKLHGLINVSGFHVDPGFQGRLIFSVYNAGGNSLVLSRGQRLFLLWISSLDGSTDDVYRSVRANQATIPNGDIMAIGHEHFSPAAVNDRLTSVENKIEIAWRVTLTLVAAAVLGTISYFGGQALDSDPLAPTPSPTSSIDALNLEIQIP